MSTVLSSSRVIQSYSQVELEPGECRYTFRLPVDSEGTTLSWTMNDEYAVALDAIQDVLSDPLQHKEAKTEEMNSLLNFNVPYFRAEDDDVVKVYANGHMVSATDGQERTDEVSGHCCAKTVSVSVLELRALHVTMAHAVRTR